MKTEKSPQAALIVGASRGIGLGLVRELLTRGWRVHATERGTAAGSPLRQLVDASEGRLQVHVANVNVPADIARVAAELGDVELGLLFINAGVSDNPKQTAAQISTEEFQYLMQTNALSPMRAIESLSAKVGATGSIAVTSSALASISANTDGGYEAYRASKAALNSLMRSYAARAGAQRSLLALHPGWVRTDMGGPEAPLEVTESVAGLLDTVDKHARKPGLSFVDYADQTIPW
jgi:NAD(P)-dependent dehydrogenase (short-subunit alcohol dehydrogenase family)